MSSPAVVGSKPFRGERLPKAGGGSRFGQQRGGAGSPGAATNFRFLEHDLGQAGLAIEALLQLLQATGTVKRENVAELAVAIDAVDGISDGRITRAGEALKARPFLSRRTWDEEGGA